MRPNIKFGAMKRHQNFMSSTRAEPQRFITHFLPQFRKRTQIFVCHNLEFVTLSQIGIYSI